MSLSYRKCFVAGSPTNSLTAPQSNFLPRQNSQQTDHPMPIRPIITGSTGMVGEGVLFECLAHPDVDQVLVINRKPGGVTHRKLREIVHADFFDLTPIEAQLVGYNACFFCAGVSSVGMNPDVYKRVTYDLTMNVARTLAKT